MEEIRKNQNIIFNSPVEIALRLLFVFSKTSKSLDLQRLIYYNYLLVHSADIPNSPKSIHADLPRRYCEMLVNRKVVKQGLTVLISKDLIFAIYEKEGIAYCKNNNTDIFIQIFKSEYSTELRQRADWLCANFDNVSDEKLEELMKENIGNWGSEFSVINDYSEDT